ncbi:hypothetical protein ACFOWE_08775 [Planomonospora corallina]|uniref:SCO6045-like C-terminal domain-containing protein n=1 Tax=Planomonospora corallina TaxID=1806052 RepID=A0ABV8I2J1_9ACTN
MADPREPVRAEPAAGREELAAGREELARAQAELVAALVAGAQPPPGFDAGRLRIQTASLVAKRRRVVARLRPDLAAALGGDFAREFTAYARSRPKPPGGYRADAGGFAEYLRRSGRIAEEPRPAPPAAPGGRWIRWIRPARWLGGGRTAPPGGRPAERAEPSDGQG